MNISTRKSLILIILVFAFDLVTACADNDKNVIQETYTIQHEGVTITVAVESFLQSGVKQQKSSLPNLFDGNLESGWLPLGRPVVYWEPEIPGCTTEITFISSLVIETLISFGAPTRRRPRATFVPFLPRIFETAWGSDQFLVSCPSTFWT